MKVENQGFIWCLHNVFWSKCFYCCWLW